MDPRVVVVVVEHCFHVPRCATWRGLQAAGGCALLGAHIVCRLCAVCALLIFCPVLRVSLATVANYIR